MRNPLRAALAVAPLALAACQVYDDIAIDVIVPLEVQEAFAATWPEKYLRPVITFDDEVGSLGVECEVAVADQTYFARFLEAGCYDAHQVEVYLTALDVEAGVPCGHDFQLGQGGRDLPAYDPSLSFEIPATTNGRCGAAWRWFALTVEELAPPPAE